MKTKSQDQEALRKQGFSFGSISSVGEEYVTKLELELERSPARLLTWVTDKVEAVAAQSNGKHAIRFGEGLLKQLMEEVRPVALFTVKHFGDRTDVLVKPAIGNQGYDATIRSLADEDLGFKFIEVTQAHEGENEHLRMLHLEEKGNVSLYGPVHKKGTKHTGISVTGQTTMTRSVCTAISHREFRPGRV